MERVPKAVIGGLAAVAWIGFAAAAHAATVRVGARPGYCGQACSKYGGSVPDVRSLHVDAGAGEANTLTVTEHEGGWTVTDSSAPLVAGDLCIAMDSHTVSCETSVTEVRVNAGDGDDTLTAGVLGARTIGQISYGPYGIHLDGGAGDDTISGGAGDDVLDGGGGTDRLDGAAGDDLLDDQDGAEPDGDRFDGGPGYDQVSYADRRAPLRVDLRGAGGQGEAGESDTFASIDSVAGGHANDRMIGSARSENLAGAAGDDVLIGGGGHDALDGGRGRDRLLGGAGNDELSGGTGRDRLRAGAGRDRVGSTDSIAERVDCGPGRDTVGDWLQVEGAYTDDVEYDIFGPDETDVLARDCERAHIDQGLHERTVPVQPVARTMTSMLFANPCVKDCERGTFRIRQRGRSVVLVTFGNRRRQPRVSVPLAPIPAGRQLTVRWRLGDGVSHDNSAFRTRLR
jgi:hypothetical protein